MTVRRYASIFILGFVAFMSVMAWFAQRFEIDASAETLLVKGNPLFETAQRSKFRYQPSEFILIAFEPDGDGPLFSNENLTTLMQLGEQIEALDRVKATRSIANVPVFTMLESMSVDIDPNDITWEGNGYSASAMARNLRNHPLYEGLLFNEAMTALSLQVVFTQDDRQLALDKQIFELETGDQLSETQRQVLARAKAEKSQLDKKLEATRIDEIEQIRKIVSGFSDRGAFFLGGNNLLAFELISIIKSDLVVFGLAILVIVSILLFYFFRAFRWLVVPLVCCACSVVTTIGLLGALGLKVTVISTNVIALQIILALAIIIHLIVQYQELLRAGQFDSETDLVLETVKQKFKPCFYAALTTAIGFGSLIFSGVQPIISFGWMMVVAMFVTLVVSLLLFPAILLTFFHNQPKVRHHPRIAKALGWMASVSNNKGKLVAVVSAIALAVGLAGCLRLSAETSFLNYFSESTDVHRELSFIDKQFGGSTPFDVLYSVPEKEQKQDLLLTAEAVQTLTSIHKMLDDQEAVGNVTSIADFTRIAKTVMAKPLTEYELTALYKTLDPELRKDLFGDYYAQGINQTRISTRIADTTEGLNREAFIDDLRHNMADLGVSEEDYEFTNLFVLYQDILARLVDSQLKTLMVVYAAIAIVLLVVFGSLKVALICLVPNVIATAMIMGLMGWAGIPLDLMTLTIAAVAMGISVDDTIHFTHRYLERLEIPRGEPIQETFLSVGYALVYTTIVIAAGFSALMFSNFVPSVLFGLLTCIAMLLALATDLSVLPVLLKRFVPRKSQNTG